MNGRDQFAAASQQNKLSQEGQARRYGDGSRRRLQKILEKKLTTSFIGALARFEALFGSLWGHGKDESELTENELAWRDLWVEARTEVLNNGNNQIRAIQQELQQYECWWHGYQTVLKPVDPNSK